MPAAHHSCPSPVPLSSQDRPPPVRTPRRFLPMSSRTSWFGALSLLLVAASLAGCGKSNPVATNSTSSRAVMEAQVSHAVALGAPVVEDGLMESADQTAIGASVAGAQAAALIQPLHYWRHIT